MLLIGAKKHKQSRVAANVNTENRRKTEKIVFEIAANVVCVFAPRLSGRRWSSASDALVAAIFNECGSSHSLKVNAILETNSLKMKQLHDCASDDSAPVPVRFPTLVRTFSTSGEDNAIRFEFSVRESTSCDDASE